MPFTYSKKPYKLEELREMNQEDILNRCSGIIINKDTLIENIKLFLQLSKIHRIQNIISNDYESVIILDKLYEEGLFQKDKVYLLDDYKQCDRSYIDITILKKIVLVIPNTYAMWNIKFNDKLYCYQYLYKNKKIENDTFSGYYDKETIHEVERIALMIRNFESNLTDIEKIVLISNYLQKYCVYKEDDKISEKELGDSKTALFKGFGVCRTFADATTLLSNNPYLKLKVRNVRSQNKPVHVWNIIEFNNKTYQIDNSRAISSGMNTIKEAKKTTKFNSEYLLFGENSLRRLNHEEIIYGLVPDNISKEDFDKIYLNTVIEYLDNTNLVDFDYENNIFYK